MSRLTQHHDFGPFLRDPWAIAVIDRTVQELADAHGWTWEAVEEEGLGLMFYVALAWEGVPRFLLSASDVYPGDGVGVEVASSENHASARADLLTELGADADLFLAISEGGVWFARWDAPHTSGERPPTARPRAG
ncbi:hypothetical protein DVA67_027540 [Solirubrobacter sp. CPCC 204708]|uniref:Uncharacterized protein n=1 Tax=Solirubrobacter deserti TaxID=2282478 RepID=A0ABT4RJM1_9ACTN|nr:hypothetical protein [Solirubrobacter deserti]MBE2319753.1 hypothetical protein [Solirubrobacter deserti]MDA0138764.1 hypothetical protein [Solirubrobacter deserti]